MKVLIKSAWGSDDPTKACVSRMISDSGGHPTGVTALTSSSILHEVHGLAEKEYSNVVPGFDEGVRVQKGKAIEHKIPISV